MIFSCLLCICLCISGFPCTYASDPPNKSWHFVCVFVSTGLFAQWVFTDDAECCSSCMHMKRRTVRHNHDDNGYFADHQPYMSFSLSHVVHLITWLSKTNLGGFRVLLYSSVCLMPILKITYCVGDKEGVWQSINTWCPGKENGLQLLSNMIPAAMWLDHSCLFQGYFALVSLNSKGRLMSL